MYEAFITNEVNSDPDLDLLAGIVKNYVSEAIISAFNAERECGEDFLQLGQQIYRMSEGKGNNIEFSVKNLVKPELDIKIDVIFSGEIFNSI